MRRDEARTLYERMLLELWDAPDDDLDDLAGQIAADDLVVHHDGQREHGPKALAGLVRQGRAPFTDITVTLDVGPAVDGDLVAARWSFAGAYRGGIPGTTAEPGTPVAFSGIDLVRIDGDRVAEYWVCSDGTALMAQLGA